MGRLTLGPAGPESPLAPSRPEKPCPSKQDIASLITLIYIYIYGIFFKQYHTEKNKIGGLEYVILMNK